MSKIDLHVHLSYESVPKSKDLFVSSYEEMLPHFKELDIKKAVLMSSGDSNSPLPMGTNSENLKIVKADPVHYAWMCNLDYTEDYDTIYERLCELKKDGAIGIGELMINKKLNHPFFAKLFEAAGKLSLPVLFHMSPEENYSYGVVDEPGLPLLEECLQKYPDTMFIGHSQTFWIEISKDAPKLKEERNQWGKGPVIEGGRVPYLFDNYPNLYGDLSANSAGCAMMRDPEFGLGFLEKNADRLFFATDMVNTDMVFPLGAWLDEKHKEGALSTETYEKICYKNAERIFNI
ncbi:MAG: amidohydrolase family protein [Eubacteriales bacterium]|nr:amidohydrolase family protein [Eubacteriales bacterium]